MIFVGREGQRTLVIAAYLQDKETQMAEISANAATGCFLGRCGDWIGGTNKNIEQRCKLKGILKGLIGFPINHLTFMMSWHWRKSMKETSTRSYQECQEVLPKKDA